MTETEKPKCACEWDCGYAVRREGAYVAGHSPNAVRPARKCACGCGMPTIGQLAPYYGDHRPPKPRMVAARAKSRLWLEHQEEPDVPATAPAAAPRINIVTTMVPTGPTLLDQMREVMARRGGPGAGAMRV